MYCIRETTKKVVGEQEIHERRKELGKWVAKFRIDLDTFSFTIGDGWLNW